MISTDRLFDRLGVTDPAAADQLLELVGAAIAHIEGRTGRYFGPVVETVEHTTGDGSRRLWLESLPAEASTGDFVAVVEQAAPGLPATALEFDADFELRTRGRRAWLERRNGYVWRCDREYVVTYEHGYPTDGLPDDIERLVLFLVKRDFAGITATDQVRSETVGPITTTYMGADAIADAVDEDAVIKAWKRLVFA